VTRALFGPWPPARRDAIRRALVAIAAVSLAVIFVRLLLQPSSDLLNHREFGRRFAAGTALYDGGLDYPYLPTWAMVHAPLAAVPAAAASPLVLVFGVAALLLLLWMLDAVAAGPLPLPRDAAFFVAAGAVILCSRFVIRDLLDGGPNLILTAMVWSALWLWQRGRTVTPALVLGAAIALKLTAAIFLVVLIVRRDVARAVAAAIAAAAGILLPAVWMGIESYRAHVALWAQAVSTGMMWSDASMGVLGPEPAGNLGLRPAVGRWIALATGGPLRDTSAVVASLAMAALAAIVLITIARSRGDRGMPASVAWAAAGVLALLLSPITWRAHLVAMLPACYLLIRRWAADQRLFVAGRAGLVAIAVPGFLLARGVAGQQVSRWSDSWSITTLALVTLLIGLTAWPTRR
jgi:alpha-1,2-mannosyltransferase